jgi:hypothetical protein
MVTLDKRIEKGVNIKWLGRPVCREQEVLPCGLMRGCSLGTDSINVASSSFDLSEKGQPE